MSEDDVVERLISCSREISRLQADLLAAMVAVADATPVAEFAPFEIAAALTWTRRAADIQLGLATDIVRRLPDVHAAMASGEIDLAKARVITEGVSVLDDKQARWLAGVALHFAPKQTTGELRASLAKLVIQTDPDAAERRHQAKVRKRRVVVQPTEDCCATLLGVDLPADSAVAAGNRLTAIARSLKRAGDPRTMDQLRADIFIGLLLGTFGSQPTGEKQRRGGVELVAPLDTLLLLASTPGHLNGYGPVIADIVRQITLDQHDTPWTYRINDEVTGRVFTGATPRRPDARLTRHVRSRDRTCRAPGCRRPACYADLDHTVPYKLGGPTVAGNLGALCRYHHRAKSEGHWVLEQPEPGVFVWRSPLGRRYVVVAKAP